MTIMEKEKSESDDSRKENSTNDNSKGENDQFPKGTI